MNRGHILYYQLIQKMLEKINMEEFNKKQAEKIKKDFDIE